MTDTLPPAPPTSGEPNLPPQPPLIWNPNTLSWQIAPAPYLPPPVGPPPAGLGPNDGPLWPGAAPVKANASIAAAVVNIICGAVMVLGVFLPAFQLERGGDIAWWPMSQTPDSSFFLLFGLAVAVLGGIRLHRDQIGLCVAVAIIAVASGLFAIADANNLQAYYMANLHYNGFAMTYGPALFIIGMAAVGSVVSVFMPKAES